MSIKFLVGRSGSGKTHFIFEDVKTKDKSIKKYILVPEQINFEYEKKLIKNIPNNMEYNVSIITFSTMAHRIFGEVGGLSGKELSESGKITIIYKIIKKLNNDLDIFKVKDISKGFIKMLLTQISSWKKSVYTYGDFENILDKLEEKSYLSKKISDLAKIYKEYEKEIENQYYDADDELVKLVQKIDESKEFSDSLIYIDSFVSFSENEFQIICKLMKNNDLVYSVISDADKIKRDETPFKISNITSKKMYDYAKNNNIVVENNIILNKTHNKNIELDSLEKNLYTSNINEYKSKTNNIHIKEFGNPYDEVKNAAKIVLKKVKNKEYSYKDFLILSSNTKEYKNIIKEVFSRYQIPFYIQEKKKMISFPLGKYFISLFNMLSVSFSKESVMAFVKSGFLDIKEERIDLLENYSLEEGINNLAWLDEERFREDEKIYEIWSEIFIPVINLKKRIAKNKSANKIVKSFYTYIKESNLEDRLNEMHTTYYKEKKYQEADRLKQAYSIFIQILDDIYLIFEEGALFLTDLKRIILTAFNEYNLNTIPFGLNEVLIGSISETSKEDVKIEIVLGAVDGSFSTFSKEESIFIEDEVQKLVEIGYDSFKTKDVRSYEDEYLVYKILTRPKKELYIYYPNSDMLGKSLIRSYIFTRIFKIFNKLDIEYDENEEKPIDIEKISVFTKNSLAYDIGRYINIEKEDYWLNILDFLFHEYNDIFSATKKGLLYKNDVNVLDKDIINDISKKEIKTSVSRLQKYRLCPFSYFVKYVLEVEERKIKEYKAVEAGSFIHEVLEKFQIAYFINKEGDNKTIREILEVIVDEILKIQKKSILNMDGVFAKIKENLIDKLCVTCEIIVKNANDSDFKPKYFELEFGERKKFPPIILDTKDGNEIRIEGKVDRVDLFTDIDGKNHIAIYDYKSGSKVFRLDDIYYGLDIQLVLYLSALLMKNNSNNPAGIFYFSVKDPVIEFDKPLEKEEIEREIRKEFKLSGLVVDKLSILDKLDKSEKRRGYYTFLPAQQTKAGFSKNSKIASIKEFEALFSYVKKELSKLINHVSKCDFKIRPIKKEKFTACDFCGYQSICQFDISVEGNNYEIIDKLDDNQVLSKIKENDNGME